MPKLLTPRSLEHSSLTNIIDAEPAERRDLAVSHGMIRRNSKETDLEVLGKLTKLQGQRTTGW